METPMAPSHFILNDPIQGHSDFKALYLVKELSQAMLTIKH